MPEDLSRKDEQRGTRNIMMWGVAIVAAVFIALLAIFVFGAGGSDKIKPETTGQENYGTNAPLQTSPPAGTKNDETNGGTKLPEAQL
ncbi:hypothetical protein [Mesorhizobium sp. 8]|uniref:hypothetical protein n=1 Tax=Mesorhizobium sp. 8 TaxID=2584466 RepID=UPI0011222456|nr:hypothetical protein [Mesorhizobium sp. 8]QDC02765.1 hypothetical protein FGU64_21445 [Mesorhizobium sp. 8]